MKERFDEHKYPDIRLPEEDHNVRINTWIYALKRQNDNDYCLIIGTGPQEGPTALMVAEVSGLPEASAPTFGALKSVRGALESFFAAHLTHAAYSRFSPP
jgi:hypothetical protein